MPGSGRFRQVPAVPVCPAGAEQFLVALLLHTNGCIRTTCIEFSPMFTPWCCCAGGPAHDPRLHPILALHLTHHDRPHQTLHKRAPINPKATDTPTGGCRTHPFVAFRLGVGSVRSFGISRDPTTGPAEGVALVRWTSGPG